MHKDTICILYKNRLNYIEKQPYESDDDAYMRGWYIIRNGLSFDNPEHICQSKIIINERVHGMTY